jgi:type IV pilus assembly protein PilA
MVLKNQKGFTLIELLVVVAIIGILAAIAIPQFSAYRAQAFCSRVESDVRNAMTAEEAYFVTNNAYTGTVANLSGSFVPSAGVTVTPSATAPQTITGVHGECTPIRGTYTLTSGGTGVWSGT